MFAIKSDNPNYLARIIKIDEVREHPNANKLALTTVQAQSIIVDKSTKVGELYVFFQLGTKINPEFLSFINGYSNSELNNDKSKKGFFNRDYVKAVRLRGIVSEGYLHPLKDLNKFLIENGIKFQFSEKDINKDFDTIGDILFTEKYVVPVKNSGTNIPKCKIKKESQLIENQFRLSPDYKHLKREIYSINPNDWIELSSKWHGCNAVIAKILTKRKFTFKEKIAKILGISIQESEYNLVYSSRRCIKSEEFRDFEASNFYDHNIWQLMAKKYQDCIKNGISLIGEIVGYTPSGKPIQSIKGKAYDYGCKEGKCDFIVFRITYTSINGDVYEFSAQQVINYCNKVGLKCIPFYFIGRAKDKYPELNTENHWHQNFLNNLIEEYLEKDDVYCLTKNLADEGIVLSRRINEFEGLKLKSQRFLLGESEDLEKGVENIEDVS